MSETTHVFEKGGLGRAPFRVVGFEVRKYQACPGAPIQCGTSCDYCYTGIMETFWIADADGKRFKVGNECVRRTGEKGLVDEAKRAAAKIRLEASHARDDARIEAARALLGAHLAATPARLALGAQPHPHKWAADKGMTALDFVTWMLDRAGRSGKIKAARMIEKAAKGETA